MTEFKHTNRVTIDIETVKDPAEWVLEYMAESVNPPSNYKDPKKIEDYLEKKVSELESKAGLDGAFCRIACIGVKIDGLDVLTFSMVDNDEAKNLSRFYDYLSSMGLMSPMLVGHNIAGFDLKILKQRSMVLGIEPPKFMQAAFNAKPWDSVIFDTMLNWDAKNFVKLDKIARAFGLESSKSIMDGSQVQGYFDEGKHKEIAAYCADDVRLTFDVYRKMNYLTAKEGKKCQVA